MKVKVDIVTSDDIKIYYTGKFQDFTARYIRVINMSNSRQEPIEEHPYLGKKSNPTRTLQEACRLVVLRFNATLTAKGHIMAVGDAHVFPGFLTPVLTQISF